jgi:hypothetical protein
MKTIQFELTDDEYARLERVVAYCNREAERCSQGQYALEQRVRLAVMDDFVEGVEGYRIMQEEED